MTLRLESIEASTLVFCDADSGERVMVECVPSDRADVRDEAIFLLRSAATLLLTGDVCLDHAPDARAYRRSPSVTT